MGSVELGISHGRRAQREKPLRGLRAPWRRGAWSATYLLHLSIERAPFFDKRAWQNLAPEFGGPNMLHESAEKITDVWCLPTSTGKNGHGAEFPLALAGRCIALTSRKGDLVLDPFIGSGTTALAAVRASRVRLRK